ncbi:MAG: (Fe-S)-binding protein [Solirubrobacteraceae bacterium]|nr:MAG: glycolate oxidase [Solirubrobacterales bacterium]
MSAQSEPGTRGAQDPLGAFDAERPPPLELIEDCVHCGFCLPACPTYALWGDELDSPRGRIVLMEEAHEPGRKLSPTVVEHWDRCLGCMACVTACPSGVRYDTLITRTRAQVERHHPRSLSERLKRRAIFALATHPARLRPLLPLARLAPALAGRGGTIGAVAALAQGLPARGGRTRPPAVTPARGVRRARVALLQGCVQRAGFGAVNAASARVLAAEGFEVHAPEAPRCCGALQHHAGDARGAMALARTTIAALEAFDLVVVNAAGCGSTMKEYGELLGDDPAWAERAAGFAGRVRDVCELLADEPRAPRHPLELSVAYHDACHLAHAQGIREQPRALLRSIPGIELHEPTGGEACCGSAGIHNIVQPEAAAELGSRSARAALETGAQIVAVANPGCALQLSAHLRSLGHPLPVRHPIELLAASLEGRQLR